MKMVIEIPEDVKAKIDRKGTNETVAETLWQAVKNGTQLPEGHGRLIDESDLMPDSDYENGIFYAVSIGAINGAPTIIEADKEAEYDS